MHTFSEGPARDREGRRGGGEPQSGVLLAIFTENIEIAKVFSSQWIRRGGGGAQSCVLLAILTENIEIAKVFSSEPISRQTWVGEG